MIELSIEIVKIVIFLIPGILSMIILERLTTHKKIEFDRFATYSIVLAFFIYIFHYVFWLITHKLYLLLKWNKPEIDVPELIINRFLNNSEIIHLFSVITVSLVGILLSFFLAYIINNKFVNRIGQCLNVTSKFGDESVWDFFHNKPKKDWVVIRDLKNDIMYYGWISIYSDYGNENDELILQNVVVYKNSTGELMYEVAEIYIAEKRENLRIEIYENGGN